jgi:predicted negative regulator of RcsB-dependent stress response
LIGFSHLRSFPVMPADLQKSPAPLAEIAQGPNAFEQFLDRNQKNLIILAVLIAVGVAALVVYRGIEKSRQETAGAALNKAEDLAALQAVINEHAGTTAASSAAILLADRQWTDGQQDTAIETLRNFISSNPQHPALPTAQASLGSKLMIQGKSADASRIFQEIVDDPKARFIAPYALISLGDIAKLAGDLAKAEASYKRVQTDFPESNFMQSAKRRIDNLKAKPPVEVDPPPAPKAETPPAPPEAPAPAPTPAPPAPKAETPPAPPVPPAPAPAPPAPTAETPPAPEAPAPAPAPPAPKAETPPAPPVPEAPAPAPPAPKAETPPAPPAPEAPAPTPAPPAPKAETPPAPPVPPAPSSAPEAPSVTAPQETRPEIRSEPTGKTPADAQP